MSNNIHKQILSFDDTNEEIDCETNVQKIWKHQLLVITNKYCKKERDL